jgi:hypothetical protein
MQKGIPYVSLLGCHLDLFLLDAILDLLVHAAQELVLLEKSLDLRHFCLDLLHALHLHPLATHSRHQLT